ncbi:MAG: hypothetical protein H0W33_02415 [Gammaproteobacteria bacterium]|nr:hypothetical protein [Gammaproteobacteria bacterium]
MASTVTIIQHQVPGMPVYMDDFWDLARMTSIKYIVLAACAVAYSLGSPNIEINGEPATFTHVKHKGGKWATVVYAPSSDRLFVVEADRKLIEEDRVRFLEMVADLSRRSG